METIENRMQSIIRAQGHTQAQVAEKLGVSQAHISSVLSGNKGMSVDLVTLFAESYNISLDWLLCGRGGQTYDDKGNVAMLGQDIGFVPILNQVVSAGPGQEVIEKSEVVTQFPVPLKLFGKGMRGVEVRGDSMTGVNIFDGDYVFYIIGLVRGDGLYVLQIGDEVYVKRLEFDPIKKVLTIISENPRYKPFQEAADSQAITILGKVKGWWHNHPY